jgi:hypothetical protein
MVSGKEREEVALVTIEKLVRDCGLAALSQEAQPTTGRTDNTECQLRRAVTRKQRQ